MCECLLAFGCLVCLHWRFRGQFIPRSVAVEHRDDLALNLQMAALSVQRWLRPSSPPLFALKHTVAPIQPHQNVTLSKDRCSFLPQRCLCLHTICVRSAQLKGFLVWGVAAKRTIGKVFTWSLLHVCCSLEVAQPQFPPRLRCVYRAEAFTARELIKKWYW